MINELELFVYLAIGLSIWIGGLTIYALESFKIGHDVNHVTGYGMIWAVVVIPLWPVFIVFACIAFTTQGLVKVIKHISAKQDKGN